MDLISALESLVPELEKGLGQASSLDALEALRVDVLGRKGRIAQIMDVSLETVRSHLKRAYQKMGVRSRGELFAQALAFVVP